MLRPARLQVLMQQAGRGMYVDEKEFQTVIYQHYK